MARLRLQRFAHGDEFNDFAGPDVELNLGAADISPSGIELDAGKRRHEFDTDESPSACFPLAMLEQQGTDATAGVTGIDEEGADLGRLRRGVEGGGIAPGAGVAAEQRRAKAPAAAADNRSAVLDHEICLVGQ